jgi:hypothetical protein
MISCAVVFIVFKYKGLTRQMEAPQPPLLPIMVQLLRDFLEPLAPDPVALEILLAAGDENVRAPSLAPLFQSAPKYRDFLLGQTYLAERLTAWTEETAELPDRERIILDHVLGLLGKVPVRNVVACAVVTNLLEPASSGSGTVPEKKIAGRPAQLIPFALEAEQLCQDRGWVGPNNAFCAGLHYDWVAAIVKKRAGPPEEKGAVISAFKEGLLTARVAYQIAQGLREFRLGKYLFPAGLLLPIGKALMACTFPAPLQNKSWSKFLADCDQAGVMKTDFLQFMERRRFPFTHAELSSLLVNFAAMLRNVEKALYFYPEAYRLKRTDPDLYQLSVLLSVSTRLVSAGTNKPVLEPFHLEWMNTQKLTEEKLKAAFSAALR